MDNTMVIMIFLMYTALCCIIYTLAVTLGKIRLNNNSVQSGKRNILFVIAHPDDECMFFSPSILNYLEDKNIIVSLLCLSNGNYYGQGALREKELRASCQVLGIQQENITIIDHVNLQDEPTQFWDETLAAVQIFKVVEEKHCEKIITFDGWGVSWHSNHISVYRAVRNLLQILPTDVKAYSLVTVNICRHYMSVLDLPFSILRSAFSGQIIHISSPAEIWKAQKAMTAHRSQFVWFRILSIIFSRYMLINTMKRISKPSPL